MINHRHDGVDSGKTMTEKIYILAKNIHCVESFLADETWQTGGLMNVCLQIKFDENNF